MTMDFLTDEDRAAMEAFERSMSNERKREAQRQLRAGQLRIFGMPTVKDARGQITATIRMLVSFPKFKAFLEHGKFQLFRTVCPIDLGFDFCEWCDTVCTDLKITRETFLEDVAYYDNKTWKDVLDADGNKVINSKTGKPERDQAFGTKEIHAWPAWYYEGEEGAGEPVIFAYQVSDKTPVPHIYRLYMMRFMNAPEAQRIDVTDFDILLTQKKKKVVTPYKEIWVNEYEAFDTVRGPFAFADKLKGLDLSREAMLFGYALCIPGQEEKWLEQIQAKQKELKKEPKPVTVPKSQQAAEEKVRTVAEDIQEELQLELSEATVNE